MMGALQIAWRPLGALIPYPRNPRTHSDAQVAQIAASIREGAVYVCMSSSELHTLQRAFTAAGGKWSTFVIWAKHTFTLGRADYQRQYEPILNGWPQGHDRYWCGARDQGDVWFVDKPARNDLHLTMKPVALVERAIRRDRDHERAHAAA
jgi:DNA modification methylase